MARFWLGKSGAVLPTMALLLGCADPEEPPPDRADRDFDGIPDSKDRCPKVAETFNHFKDLDGCPDTAPKPPPKRFDPGAPLVFEGRSDNLSKASVQQLSTVLKALQASPSLSLRIDVYVDNQDNDTVSLDLTQRRGQAIADMLVKAGIEGTRLEVRGMGSASPVAPNDTEENRLKNHRVELFLLEP